MRKNIIKEIIIKKLRSAQIVIHHHWTSSIKIMTTLFEQTIGYSIIGLVYIRILFLVVRDCDGIIYYVGCERFIEFDGIC